MISREFWDTRHRGSVEKRIAPCPSLRYLDFELDRVFRRRLSNRKGQRLLEVGCGSSLWLPYFRKRFGLEIAGIDHSEPGLEAARRILARHGLDGDLRHRDLCDPGRELDSAFDVVFSLGFVEHLDDPAEGIEKMAGFLAPGGVMVTWTPNTAGPIMRWSRRLDPDPGDFYRPLDPARLAALHRHAGLDIVEAEPVQFLDFTMLSLRRCPAALRPWAGRALRAAILPVQFAVRFGRLRVRRPGLCAGLIVVARKPA